jgi:hypothetical protein
MGQNGQESVKQPGVGGVGLADTDGRLKLTMLDLCRIYMLHYNFFVFKMN